jgi:hypothetical protein
MRMVVVDGWWGKRWFWKGRRMGRQPEAPATRLRSSADGAS